MTIFTKDRLDLVAQTAPGYVSFSDYSPAELAAARAIACAVIPIWGAGEGAEAKREQEAARSGDIWNDHIAVQAALVAVRMANVLALGYSPIEHWLPMADGERVVTAVAYKQEVLLATDRGRFFCLGGAIHGGLARIEPLRVELKAPDP